MPPYTIDCHLPAHHESFQVKSPCHIPTFVGRLTDEQCLSTRCTVHRPHHSTHPIWLHHGRQSVSPNLLQYGLQVHLQSRSILPSKCISKHARLWPAGLYDHGLQVNLQPLLIMVFKGLQSRSITAYRFA